MTRARVLRVTLRPTPSPPATPVRPVIVSPPVVPARSRAVAVTAQGRSGGPAALQGAASHPQVRTSSSRPVWDVTAGRSSGTVASGSGTAAGAGSGAGNQGNGTDGTSGTTPCGFVTFSDPHGSQFDSRTRGFWVDIRMSVHFADGSSQSMILDYPWYYPSEAANPWSDRNLRDPNFLPRFQPPPAEKSANEPALVRYVAEHSTSDGMTLLRDCPTSAPTPAV